MQQEQQTAQTAHPLRLLSPSSLSVFRTCPRKYELEKIGRYSIVYSEIGRQATQHTAYGTAFGAGLAAMLTGASLDKSLFTAICTYDVEEIYPTEYALNKSLFHCIENLKLFWHQELSELSQDWKVLLTNGKPAEEVGFAMELPGGFYFRGFLDLVLQHRENNSIITIEVKTDGSYVTANSELREAKYRNSLQGTSYSLVADWLAEENGISADISVVYLVHYTRSAQFISYPFPKSTAKRIKFLDDLLATTDYIEHLIKRNKPFPMSGNCVAYNSVCPYYGICEAERFDFTQIPEQEIAVTRGAQGKVTIPIIPFDRLIALQEQRLANDFEGI